MKKLDFPCPFSGERGLDFINCFASVYMYLEGIRGDDDYDCPKTRGGSCEYDRCDCVCHKTWQSLQGRFFGLFNTMTGRSIMLTGWGGKRSSLYREICGDTDGTVDFVAGYAGYSYEKHSDNLMEYIRTSIDGGVPVLARMKDNKHGSFRVVIGYDGDKLLMPNPKKAKNPPKRAPRPSEIDSVYVISKAARKYTLLDGLKRVKRVMEADREAGVWDEYIDAFGKDKDFGRYGLKELKRVYKTAWDSTMFHCHHFSCTFDKVKWQINWMLDEIQDPRLAPIYGSRLEAYYGGSHSLQWQLRSLCEMRNWRRKFYGEVEWGMRDTAAYLFQELKKCDETVYDSVCEFIDILEENAK